MKALGAGCLAWLIEFSIVLAMLFIVKYEENKVIRGRKK